MTDLHVAAERRVGAPAEQVYRLIADVRAHHPQFLPSAFSDFQVEQGGIGAGTVHRFKLTAGGRTRAYRMQVEEPQPGRVLTESDQLSSAVTTFTVIPKGRAAGCGSRPAGRAPPHPCQPDPRRSEFAEAPVGRPG
jgi:Polyketide cyclase / dehydrase and lipid transport